MEMLIGKDFRPSYKTTFAELEAMVCSPNQIDLEMKNVGNQHINSNHGQVGQCHLGLLHDKNMNVNSLSQSLESLEDQNLMSMANMHSSLNAYSF